MGASRPSRHQAGRQAGRGRDLQRRARQCGRRRDDDRGGARVRRSRASRRAVGAVHRQHRRGTWPARRRLFRRRTRPCPPSKIVGLVDLDMPLLLYDFTDVVAFGAEHSTIGQSRRRGRRERWASRVSPDPMPQEALFVRSDHYPFVQRGVPAVLLMTGYANGGQRCGGGSSPTSITRLKDDLSPADPLGGGGALRRAQLPDRAQHGRRRPAAHVVRGRLFRGDRSPRRSPRRSADAEP